MGSAKGQLVEQRRAKIAALKPAKAAFEDQMAQKRQLRQLFKKRARRVTQTPQLLNAATGRR